jgi:hypothetical protein
MPAAAANPAKRERRLLGMAMPSPEGPPGRLKWPHRESDTPDADLKWPHLADAVTVVLECRLPRLLPDRRRRVAGQGGALKAKRGRTTLRCGSTCREEVRGGTRSDHGVMKLLGPAIPVGPDEAVLATGRSVTDSNQSLRSPRQTAFVRHVVACRASRYRRHAERTFWAYPVSCVSACDRTAIPLSVENRPALFPGLRCS